MFKNIKVKPLKTEIYKNKHITFINIEKIKKKYVRASLFIGRKAILKENSSYEYIPRIAINRPTKQKAFKDIKKIIDILILMKVDIWVMGFIPKNIKNKIF